MIAPKEVMNTACAAKLWLQYLDKVLIGDWTTQMIELWKMSPYLSAVDSMTPTTEWNQ